LGRFDGIEIQIEIGCSSLPFSDFDFDFDFDPLTFILSPLTSLLRSPAMQNKLTEKNLHRAGVYRLLSACYCLPDEEFREEGLAENLAAALEPVCAEAVPYARAMAEALAESDLTTGLLVDYSALFIGPFKLKAPPYGSVYLDKERRLMGDTTVDAVMMYRKAGVEMDAEEQKDIPDNIVVELEFMYYLISKEFESLTDSNLEEAARFAGIREDFMKKHLGAWAFKFTENVKQGAKNDFYKNLAICTEIFLGQEMDRELSVAA
jgi:TorA maturation chaperone TorD